LDIFATKIGKQDNNADFLCFDKSDKKQEEEEKKEPKLDKLFDDFFKSFFKQRSI
jgi:DNA polymerase sigma